MDSNQRKQLYRVDTELEVTCLIEFAAPYGDSQQATLPPGMVVNACLHDDQTDRDSITARVVNAGDWAPSSWTTATDFPEITGIMP